MDQQTYNDQEFNDFYQDDLDAINPYLHSGESINQVFSGVQGIAGFDDSVTSSNLSMKSAVWAHFDKNPSYAQGYGANHSIMDIRFITCDKIFFML